MIFCNEDLSTDREEFKSKDLGLSMWRNSFKETTLGEVWYILHQANASVKAS